MTRFRDLIYFSGSKTRVRKVGTKTSYMLAANELARNCTDYLGQINSKQYTEKRNMRNKCRLY